MTAVEVAKPVSAGQGLLGKAEGVGRGRSEGGGSTGESSAEGLGDEEATADFAGGLCAAKRGCGR
jgi:hypothetical protein